MKICSVDGCETKSRRGGMCAKHYTRMYRNGDLHVRKNTPGAAKEWLYSFLEKGNFPEECVLWPFKSKSRGYAQIQIDNKRIYGHQISCEFIHGKKPETAELVRHLCNNGHLGCINPNHVVWGTYKENTEDYLRMKKGGD